MMTCRECQDEILLHAGGGILPAEVLQHLGSCPECLRFRQDVASAATRLVDAGPLLPDDLDEDKFVSEVERRLEQAASRSQTWIGRRRYVAAAAAVVLVVGASLIGLWMARSGRVGTAAGFEATGATTQASLSALFEDEVDRFDNSVFELILSDFVAERHFEAGGLLLDDLSEEELRYLEENFDVGELL
ncbi:MAG TPA: hypothetical protein VMY05_11175 [Acidobacteriota bacterium]|nr:hypothetical protein [Acidobacteriota bacterium]